MIYNDSMKDLDCLVRDLDDEFKIQAPSCPEIQDGIEAEAKRLARRGLKWKQAVGKGPFMNMVFAWYLALPADERERIALAGRESLKSILSQPYEEPENPASPKRPQGPLKANGRGGSAKTMPSEDRNTNKPVGKDSSGFSVGQN